MFHQLKLVMNSCINFDVWSGFNTHTFNISFTTFKNAGNVLFCVIILGYTGINIIIILCFIMRILHVELMNFKTNYFKSRQTFNYYHFILLRSTAPQPPGLHVIYRHKMTNWVIIVIKTIISLRRGTNKT